MSMIIDPVYPSTGTSQMTQDWYNRLEAARQALLTNSNIMTMVSSIRGNVIFTTYSDGLVAPSTGLWAPYNTADAGNATWRANLITHFASKGVTYDPARDFIVLLEPYELSALVTQSYDLDTYDGGTYDYTFERLMFHEMAHAASLPTSAVSFKFLLGNFARADPWEADTIAIAAENIIYRQDRSGPIAGGHDGAPASGGFSGVKAFDALNGSPTMVGGVVDGGYAVTFSETVGNETVKKMIFERGYDPAGYNSTKYNHYIINEITNQNGVIADEGSPSDLLLQSLYLDSAGGAAADHKIQKTYVALDQFSDFKIVLATVQAAPSSLMAQFQSLPELDQTVGGIL